MVENPSLKLASNSLKLKISNIAADADVFVDYFAWLYRVKCRRVCYYLFCRDGSYSIGARTIKSRRRLRFPLFRAPLMQNHSFSTGQTGAINFRNSAQSTEAGRLAHNDAFNFIDLLLSE
jgi:hypothetical protein